MFNFINFIQNNLIISTILVILFIIYFFFEINNIISYKFMIEASEVIKFINEKNAIVLDLRSKDKYIKNHIINAINYDIKILKKNDALSIKKYKKKYLIVYSSSEYKDKKAYKYLKKLGFLKIYCINGGFNTWIEKNLPIV